MLPADVREDYSACTGRSLRRVDGLRYGPTVGLAVLAERLGQLGTGTDIAGRNDPLVPPSNAEFLHARLTESSSIC